MDRGRGPLNDFARILLGVLAVAAAFGALVAFAADLPFTASLAALGAVMLGLGAAYEHGRYRARLKAAGPTRFERTDEVFTDPTSGQLTRVWYDPVSGARDYRPDA
ncbi:MAG: hypothetical protein ACHQZR_07165 [Candidatus Limnocylindrales bacterium]